METDKVITWSAIAVAGIICLVFLLDLAFKIFDRPSITMDVLFIMGASFLLWQGIETVRELRELCGCPQHDRSVTGFFAATHATIAATKPSQV